MIPRDIAHKDDLRLEVETLFSRYSPGDTIIGNVIRKSPIVSPEATLKIWLTGIMTVRILRDRGSDDHVYTEKWTLLDPTEQLIFRGPLHHPENSKTPFSWPFSVPIPTKPRASITQGHQPQASFVPFFNKDHPAYHILPESFRTFCDGYASKSEAVVEYRLHARLYYERGGSKKNHYATMPIALRHASGNIDTDQLHISKQILSYPTKVRSRRLLPDIQKTKKFFGSSKTPEFWFKILMASPPVVQFNNPEPLPISLRITTLKGNDRTSKSIEDIPQQIQINYLKIRIKSWTTVIASGHRDRQDFDVDFHFEDVFENLENPLVIDSSANTPINLGNMFRLVLQKDSLYANGKRCSFTGGLYPDFSTFAIKHTHQFDYRINLTVAGQTLEVKVIVPVKIIEAA